VKFLSQQYINSYSERSRFVLYKDSRLDEHFVRYYAKAEGSITFYHESVVVCRLNLRPSGTWNKNLREKLI